MCQVVRLARIKKKNSGEVTKAKGRRGKDVIAWKGPKRMLVGNQRRQKTKTKKQFDKWARTWYALMLGTSCFL
jgi:hypothetical protein